MAKRKKATKTVKYVTLDELRPVLEALAWAMRPMTPECRAAFDALLNGGK